MIMSAIRAWFDTPNRRAYVHAVVLAVFGVITVSTKVDPSLGVLIAAAAVAVFDLVLALLHSSAKWRTLLYGVVIALQPIGVAVAIGTSEQWASGLVLLSAILGVGLAAAKTPVPAEYGTSESTVR
ncbi:holin [Gordonia phage Malisha]|nr:holin [Gordonia phage Malisha]